MKSFWQIFIDNKIEEITWLIKRLPAVILKLIGAVIAVVLVFAILILFFICCGWVIHYITGWLAQGDDLLDSCIKMGVWYSAFVFILVLIFGSLIVWLRDNYERAEYEFNNQKDGEL